MFKACIKKEFLDEIRTKRFLKFCLFACGMVALTMVVFAMMSMFSNITSNYVPEDSSQVMVMIQGLFETTYQNSAVYFAAFMTSYFSIIYMIMLMNLFGKEISQNRWLLPISAGLSTKDMILSKVLVKTASLLLSVIIAILLHFVLTLIFFSATATFGMAELMITYAGVLFLTLFMSVLILSLNAISKKAWVGITIGLTLLIIGSIIFEGIIVDAKSLITYTPLLFYELTVNPTVSLDVWQIVFSIGSYILTLVGLVLWAIFSNKIKPSKGNKSE